MDNQNQQPTMQQPIVGARSKKKTIVVTIIVLLLLATVGFSVYIWQQTRIDDLNRQVIDAKAQDLPATQPVQTPKENMVTEGLPNGKTLAYPLNENNASVIWWSGKMLNPNGGEQIMYVSSKKIVQFLSTIPSDTISEVCGEMRIDTGGILVAAVSLTTKSLDFSRQAANCLDLFAAENSIAPDYKEAAQKLSSEVRSDLEAFVKSASIK